MTTTTTPTQNSPSIPTLPPSDFDVTSFDWIDYMRQFPAELLKSPIGRRQLTKNNPLLFALLYFRPHLTSVTTGQITFSDFHLQSCYTALNWARPITKPMQYRDCVIAPRETGKSTWWFLILIMWAAAHGHAKFVAAYSDTATQAERHLDSFKRELANNALLRRDFRELGEPSRKATTGRPEADNAGMIMTASGFVFVARGIDSGNLGLKVGSLRPDLLILDDIEPHEANYSVDQVKKRLGTVQDVILPMNLNARVVIAGTVTMAGSIIHQLVQTITTPDAEAPKWIAEENIRVHYAPPIIDNPDGSQRSLWPAKWTLDFLKKIQHTRSFSKNFANMPIGADGTYWTEDSIQYTDDSTPPSLLTYMSIDPAVSSGPKSDYTGIAVVGYTNKLAPGTDAADSALVNPDGLKGTAIVKHVEHLRVAPGPLLRKRVLELLKLNPTVKRIIIETNQGGETWQAILHTMPVKIDTVHQSVNKEVRAGQLLTDYETGHVLHDGVFTDAETEMQGFPFASHDDMVDAIGTAVEKFREQEQLRARTKKAARRPVATSSTY